MRATRAPKDFPVAGPVRSRKELESLVQTVAIAGYSSVIRRIVRNHFEPCDVCHLPVRRRDDSLQRPLHDTCRLNDKPPAKRPRAHARRVPASQLHVPPGVSHFP